MGNQSLVKSYPNVNSPDQFALGETSYNVDNQLVPRTTETKSKERNDDDDRYLNLNIRKSYYWNLVTLDTNLPPHINLGRVG